MGYLAWTVWQRAIIVVGALGLLACEPSLVVGETTCFSDTIPGQAPVPPEPRQPPDEALPIPWSTGFESGFCEFVRGDGYCYVNTEATHTIVREPVRSGRFAAAFGVSTENGTDALQSRCVRPGILPEAAYYGAWYYVPATAQNRLTWNLFHFEGWTDEAKRLWDVSLQNAPSGELRLVVFNQAGGNYLISAARRR